MASSIFDDKSRIPGPDDLAAALGLAHSLWNELKNLLASQHDALAEEWVHSGKNYGWSLRLKQKKRVILYMTPCARHFRGKVRV